MSSPAPLAFPLVPPPDPVETYARLASYPYPILLDSVERGPRGRYSYAAADPVTVVRSRGSVTEQLEAGRWRAAPGDALSAASAAMGSTRDALPQLPPFQGGAAGYVGYDWGATLERIPAAVYDDLALPDVLLGVYDALVAWDHEQGTAWIVSSGIGGRHAGERLAWMRGALARDAGAGAHREAASSSPAPHPRLPAPPTWPVPSFADQGVRSTFAPDDYRSAVSRIVEYILAGDAFQVNLSQRFEIHVAESPLALYRRLRNRHPASFSAIFDGGTFNILSASPERFLQLHGRRVETRPIKGTRPRGATPDEDAALEAALAGSAKDRAENVMIVDLLRNDLSRVCEPGTVDVTELCVAERHPTVHHLVSTVVGTMEHGIGAVELLRATFPGGSVTGAPKIRAMEIIAELEPTRRGVYCGAIGYLSVTGAMDTSIAIRTAIIRGGVAYVSAGGGVTAESDPAAEYDETIAKARGILDALGGA